MNVATGGAHGLHCADDDKGIVKFCWTAIFDMHFGDGISTVALFMDHALVDADTGEHIGSRALHKMQVTRVIDDTGKIGVLEIYAHRKQVLRAVKMALIGCWHGHWLTA